MVYVNSKKYACESCIKGHRSSSCHHNDRPLFEIKKKGRPVSQCEKCREARQARRIHAKCVCDMDGLAAAPAAEGAKKKAGKRFIPTVPSLPNGLRDAFKSADRPCAESTGPKRPVDALLNPCHCKDVYNCKCLSQPTAGPSMSKITDKPMVSSYFSDGLSALALVASHYAPASPSILPPIPPLARFSKRRASDDGSPVSEGTSDSKHILPPLASQIRLSGEIQPSGSTKRKRSSHSPPSGHRELPVLAHSRPRLLRYTTVTPLDTTRADNHSHFHAPPRFSPITSTSSPPFASTTPDDNVGTNNLEKYDDDVNCCCGTRCECAGCRSHGTADADNSGSWIEDATIAGPSTSHNYLGTGGPELEQGHRAICATCVDHDGGVELPPLSSVPGVALGSRAPAPSFLDAFFARAASLPAPPPVYARKSLDPTNVIVYPRGLFVREDRAEDERPRAFGLVRVPKLEECCEGRCGCNEGACDCGDACGGCCMDSGDSAPAESGGVGGEGSTALGSENARLSPSISFARQSIAPTSSSNTTSSSRSSTGPILHSP
ncbi:hypothetical protein M0805_000028 [Coniferiporia weirii]|nr:hypothetical protein M0805_000028 [Coniferiporia weirii]